MNWKHGVVACLAIALMGLAWPLTAQEAATKPAGPASASAPPKVTIEELTQKLWTKQRTEAALKDIEKQKADGVLSEKSYTARKKMLEGRVAGSFKPTMLSAEDPPINFIQNNGFEEINPNTQKEHSRWLWWAGWNYGGNYENSWDEKDFHGGKRSAKIACVGQTGRIGVFTPKIPAVPGVQEYRLTFWAKGEGENMLFVNFEGNAVGNLQQKLPGEWKQYTLVGKPGEKGPDFMVFFYSTGAGTIWLDDVDLVPVGGSLD